MHIELWAYLPGVSYRDPTVRVLPLADLGGDARGASFPLCLDGLTPALAQAFGPPFGLQHAHVAVLRPGSMRGNHFHLLHHEILLVLTGVNWSLWWDCGEGTAPRSRSFDGSEAVAVFVAPHCSHAVRNDGERDMHIVGLSDRVYDHSDPDTHPRKVV